MSNNVIGQVSGGTKQVFDNVYSVRDLAEKLGATTGYTASLNGEPAEMHEVVNEGDMVIFAKSVKGGLL